MLELVAEAVQGGSRKSCACEALGLSLRTVQRWERGGVKDRRKGSRAVAANRLSEAERARVIDVLNTPAYRDKGPNQIVPLLADDGGISGFGVNDVSDFARREAVGTP